MNRRSNEAEVSRFALQRVRRRVGVRVFGPRRVRAVVLGHQKSGTTAVGSLMALAMKSDFANDPLFTIDWGRGDSARALLSGSLNLRDLVQSNRGLFCSKVLKDPDLTFKIPECARTFSNARLVFVVRDPRDTIRSIADRLELTSEDLARTHARGVNRHWQLILDGELPTLRGSSVVERLAERWRITWARRLEFDGSMTVLRYEDFLADKARAIHDLVTGLGFEVRSDVSPYVDVSFQRRGAPSVDLYERMGARNVRAIEAICGAEMESLGYAVQRAETASPPPEAVSHEPQ